MDGNSGSGWHKCQGVAMLSLNHLYGLSLLTRNVYGSIPLMAWFHGTDWIQRRQDHHGIQRSGEDCLAEVRGWSGL